MNKKYYMLNIGDVIERGDEYSWYPPSHEDKFWRVMPELLVGEYIKLEWATTRREIKKKKKKIG